MSNQLRARLAAGDIDIPPVPHVLARVKELLRDESTGLREVGEVIAQEPALAGRVLRIANSALYGAGEPILSVPRAATVMGIDALHNLVLQAALRDEFAHLEENEALDFEGFWRHSLLVARFSKEVGALVRRPLHLLPDELHTCGLLHDVGVLLLLANVGPAYHPILVQGTNRGESLQDVEERELGTTHCAVGARLCQLWGLPTLIHDVVLYHHAPGPASGLTREAAIVHIADRLAYAADAGARVKSRSLIGPEREKFVGLPHEDLDSLCAEALHIAEEVREQSTSS